MDAVCGHVQACAQGKASLFATADKGAHEIARGRIQKVPSALAFFPGQSQTVHEARHAHGAEGVQHGIHKTRRTAEVAVRGERRVCEIGASSSADGQLARGRAFPVDDAHGESELGAAQGAGKARGTGA